jgi:sporulation protein YlmC with PRC-barrel domain
MQPNMSDWQGSHVYDSHGEKIGTVKGLFVDKESQQPEWLVVDTGMMRPEVLVPITGLEEVHDGIQLPFSKEQVRKAPHAGNADILTIDQERDLYSHYGIPYSTEESGSVLPAHEEMTGRGGVIQNAGATQEASEESRDSIDRQQGDIDEEEPGKRAA